MTSSCETTMTNARNDAIYRAWAPVYDLVMRPVYGGARRRAIEILALQPGEHVLIPGVGTGLDLPLLPAGVHVTAADINPAMLARARTKIRERDVNLVVADAQALQFPDASFDAVILNLILSVVPDGAAASREAWRVLRPGGRAVIFDKFLPERASLSPLRRAAGWAIRLIGTDPNRRLSDMIGGAPDLRVERDEASLLGGQYRIVLLRKDSRGNPVA